MRRHYPPGGRSCLRAFAIAAGVAISGNMLLSWNAAASESPSRVGWGRSFSEVVALPAGEPSRSAHYGAAPEQFVELWLPPESTGPLPVVALIHGGCWLAEYDITHLHALSDALAAQGFAVLSVEYRRHGSPGAAWPDPIDNVVAAIGSLPALADDRLDLSRVALVGHSAGGHLALLAAKRLEHARAPTLRGVIGLAAISDLTVYGAGDNSCQRVVPEMLGGSPEALPGLYAEASPRAHPAGLPTVMLHGDADPIVPLSQSRDMPGADLEVLQGAGHFDLIHPDSAAFDTLVEHLGRLLAPGNTPG